MTIRDYPQLLLADKKARVYNVPPLAAAGMKGGHFFRLAASELIRLPPASRFFMLPGRSPVGYNPAVNRYTSLDDRLAVAAFLPPGYTTTYNSAYVELGRPVPLPLYAYSAACLYRGNYYAAGVRVDRDARHDPRLINRRNVRENIQRLRKVFSPNRLVRHLETCALTYCCPNAQNFFLGRYEAPLPVSPHCNARCGGCISFQPGREVAPAQPRIRFVPSPQEIAQAALFHIGRVRDPVVSFGQGCEGEPLLAADTIEAAIRLIRKETALGVINMNTNASRPGLIARLFDAGLDSIRVSFNSARAVYYNRYYQPRDYSFGDVVRSLAAAKRKRGFVSINYLTVPGFTDSADEFAALGDLLKTGRVDMIQWRNLNCDPLWYFRRLRADVVPDRMIGIRNVIASLARSFPRLEMGYFNPSRARLTRHSATLRAARRI